MGFDFGDLKRLGKKVIKHAPLVGGLLGGPGGESAGNMLATLFGVEPGDTKALEERMLDAKGIADLKKFEMEHKVELEKLAIQAEQMYLTDKQSARQREMEVVKATGSKDWYLYTIASVLFFGFFALIGVLIFKPLPEDSNGVIYMLFGNMGAGFMAVVTYFFGSSKGSKDKTHMIYKMNGNSKPAE